MAVWCIAGKTTGNMGYTTIGSVPTSDACITEVAKLSPNHTAYVSQPASNPLGVDAVEAGQWFSASFLVFSGVLLTIASVRIVYEVIAGKR